MKQAVALLMLSLALSACQKERGKDAPKPPITAPGILA